MELNKQKEPPSRQLFINISFFASTLWWLNASFDFFAVFQFTVAIQLIGLVNVIRER